MVTAREKFSDRVWRMLDVKWQKDPNNSGSHLTGQRFNRVGQHALYLGIDHTTAIAEFHQTLIRPGTLAAYDIVCDDIIDLTQTLTREALGIDLSTLRCDWRRIAIIERGEPPTWTLADRLIADGIVGALVPSLQVTGTNLVLWRWHRAGTGGEGAAVTLVDPGGDLLP
jgi:RES domain-containing protein